MGKGDWGGGVGVVIWGGWGRGLGEYPRTAPRFRLGGRNDGGGRGIRRGVERVAAPCPWAPAFAGATEGEVVRRGLGGVEDMFTGAWTPTLGVKVVEAWAGTGAYGGLWVRPRVGSRARVCVDKKGKGWNGGVGGRGGGGGADGRGVGGWWGV